VIIWSPSIALVLIEPTAIIVQIAVKFMCYNAQWSERHNIDFTFHIILSKCHSGKRMHNGGLAIPFKVLT
jgi:hypothetical protein